jgi:hypothetical protein
MLDRKITTKELAEQGLIIDGVEVIPPVPLATQAYKRHKREIPYYKLFGNIYYQSSELQAFAEDQKRLAAV